MNVVTERARELQKVFRRVVSYKEEEGREREGGERKTAKRELKKGHGGRGEGSQLSGGGGGNGSFFSIVDHGNLFGQIDFFTFKNDSICE